MRNLEERGTLGALSSEVLPFLQVGAVNEPLLPNLRTLKLWPAPGKFIPLIPSFLSPRTTLINIGFDEPDLPKAVIASMVTTFPILCPNLKEITLRPLPRDPMITTGVSGMLLATNRNTLQRFHVDSPLTEGREVIYKLPNLRELSAVIEGDTSLPSAVLPYLTSLTITCDHGHGWLQMFHGATFGKPSPLSSNRAALAVSTQNTLSWLYLHTSCSWNPSYTSLLPFTQMKYLEIRFSCRNGCSSSVDDDILTKLVRAMPKLENLQLGDAPCCRIPIGVTAKGLVALTHHCPNISFLCIRFQVASLSAPPATAGVTSNAEFTPRRDCALTELDVGAISVPEESVLTVAPTLAHIFPRIESINYVEDENWDMVEGTISLSREIINYSSKQSPPLVHCTPATDYPLQNG